MKLGIIISSTRPDRKGKNIGDWVFGLTAVNHIFTSTIIDLKEINLPLLDEPGHPKTKQYIHDHTWKWSETIDKSDAFIIITPEYNGGFPAPLKNAIDYLYNEWRGKPLGIISYGGISGGAGAAEMLRKVALHIGMRPIDISVKIVQYTQYYNKNGNFVGSEELNRMVTDLIDELAGALNYSIRKKEDI